VATTRAKRRAPCALGERVGELLGAAQDGEDRRLAACGAALHVLGDEAVELALALDVAFDEVDATLVIDGDIDRGRALR
jgi:hypothetical protein